MASSAASDFSDMVTNFRRGMIPVVGAVALGVLTLVVLLLHWKGQRLAFLVRWSLVLCSLFQVVSSVSYLITPQWTWGVQLGLTGVFSLYAALSRRSDFLVMNSFVGLFNLLALLGRLAWFSYVTPLYAMFDTGAYQPCLSWFDLDLWDDTPLCYQYTTAIRFLSYLVVFLAAKQTFVSYFLAKLPEPEHGGPTYEEVGVNKDAYPYNRGALY